MNSNPFEKLSLGAICLAVLIFYWRESPTISEAPAAAVRGNPEVGPPASRIDRHIAARWKEKAIIPAPRSGDAEFIRRLYLDLAGRIPSILEVRDFLDDDRLNKRALWIERLLNEPTYARHFANVWRAILFAQAGAEQARALAPGLEAWLQQRLEENTSYDRIARELLTAVPSVNTSGAASLVQINEQKAENLAGAASRLFLGVKLECAQCHGHPFGRWTRVQFWEFAAFFASIDPERSGGADRRELTIPATGQVVQPRFLDGTTPRWQTGVSAQATLADWMTAAENPFFARAAVNRLWAYFFGIGLIDPVDEPGDHNPPSHPELLDELAREFAASGFDLKSLIRTIVTSEAYQRSSVASQPGPDDPRLFARRAVRGLSPEQLLDSIAEAAEYRRPPPFAAPELPSPWAEFLARFPHQDRAIESYTTILQALFMMNSKFTADITSVQHNRTLATIATSDIGTARRVETLYLVLLSRTPRPEEAARLIAYVDRGGPTGDRTAALADVFWVLLNSAEFMLNH